MSLALAIDTATQTSSIALCHTMPFAPIAEQTWQSGLNHTQTVTIAIQTLLKLAQLTISDLNLVVVSQGPGSFNGLRVGLSVAKGIALARKLPILPIPTLDSVAFGVSMCRARSTRLIAIAQAGRGRVVAQSYDAVEQGWQSRGDLQIAPPEAALRYMKGTEGETLVAGEIDAATEEAIAILQQEGSAVRALGELHRTRRASVLCEMAVQHQLAGRPLPEPASIVPIYLHQPGVPHP
ncbi:MAG: tRNA (adenosine(37)-N6)-threonylcarbamoyltransferase complex dimerization subunit type 1 TsaB [Anaerolineae bacterium]